MREKPTTVSCETCRGQFQAHHSELSRGKGRFCSRKCRHEWRSPWRRLVPQPNGCIDWPGPFNRHGYGVAMSRGRRYSNAHRVAFERHNGVCILKGFMACHRCDRRQCVNPAHVFIGTAHDNSLDAKTKGRLATGDASGSRRHPELLRRGEGNASSKLTNASVAEARRQRASGETLAAIAARLGVSINAIHAATSGKTWRHVACPTVCTGAALASQAQSQTEMTTTVE